MNYLRRPFEGFDPYVFNDRQLVKVRITKETASGYAAKTIYASLARLNRLANDARIFKFEQV